MTSPARPTTIADARRRIAAGATHRMLVDEALDAIASDAAAHVFTSVDAEGACAAADRADERQRAGTALRSPLDGLAISVKDLFDVAGQVTCAGSRVRDDAAPAAAHAPSIARLADAGAAIVGRTNMTEFAFSGVGINPHFGTPRNPMDAHVARIAGGSSSGAAVSVALGIAVAAMGSDTGGSIRIPAALCGVVGFKSTQSRVPLAGAFPLSRTLDTVCAITACVEDAIAVDALIADAASTVEARGLRETRLAVPRTVVLDAMDETVARAFDRTLRALRDAGATLVDIDVPEFAERDRMKVAGGFSSPESWAVHRATLATMRDRYDPRVVARIERGRDVSAADYLDLVDARAAWIAAVERRIDGYDAMLFPTVPIVAPPTQPLIDDDDAFFATNALLLRNPSLINFLDGCAISIPCHREDELPVGLTIASTRGRDAEIAAVALGIEARLTQVRGR